MVASVASQTPQTAARPAPAELQLFTPGQRLEAVVAGQASNGLTLLKIGDVVVAAKLPQQLPVGTTLELQVKAGGGTPQLTIVSQSQPQVVAVVPGRVTIVPQAVVLPGLPPAVAAAGQQAVIATGIAQVTIAESGQGVATAGSGNESAVGGGQAQRGEIAAGPSTPVVSVAGNPANTEGGKQGQPVGSPTSASASGVAGAPTASAGIAPGAAVKAPVGLDGGLGAKTAPHTNEASGQPPIVRNAGVAGLAALKSGEAQLPLRSFALGQPATLPGAPAQITLSAAGEGIAASPLLLAQEAARPVTVVVGELPKTVVPVAPAQGSVPPLPETPVAALLQMMPEAMARQDSIGQLLLSLAALVAKPTGLPEPILRAAMQVLVQRVVVPGETVSAEALEKAVRQSGVFLEAGLAKAVAPPADLKAALLGLRGVLGKFLGEAAPPMVGAERTPPPVRGLLPRAAPIESPALPDAPHDIARLVHGQADAAVSRVKLMQLASLPDQQPAQAAKAEFRMELPFLIGHELVMAQIQIARDGGRKESDRKRGWTMRFAMNFAATGEIGADVGLLGKTVSVALWAGDAEVADRLGATLPELGIALEAIGLRPGALHVRRGAPEAGSVPTGRLLDSVS